MQKEIFDIGSGRYYFDKRTLDSFIEEAKGQNSCVDQRPSGSQNPSTCPDSRNEADMDGIFHEVMSLYHDYLRSHSVDVLVKLKCRLQDVSVRYNSRVLAEEVLTINSCLPYEQRIVSSYLIPQ